MAEIFQALWETWRPGQNVLIGLIAVSPFLFWTGYNLFHLYFRKDVTPPQQEKVLRPPGYSLQLRLDDLFDTILQTLVWTTLILLAFSNSECRMGRRKTARSAMAKGCKKRNVKCERGDEIFSRYCFKVVRR